MTNEDSLFEFLEEDSSSPDTSLGSIVRWFRQRYIPGTISTHFDELGAILRYPFGFSWRKAFGMSWCPYCTSLSPRSMLDLAMSYHFWDPSMASAEHASLVARGEVDKSRSSFSPYTPLPGSAFGAYMFEDDEPKVFCLILPKVGRVGMTLDHIYDLRIAERSALVSQMNRLSPMLHWSIDDDGDLSWSHVGLAIVHTDESDE